MLYTSARNSSHAVLSAGRFWAVLCELAACALNSKDWNRWMDLIDIRLHVGACMCLCIQVNMLGKKKNNNKKNQKDTLTLQTNTKGFLYLVCWCESGVKSQIFWNIHSQDTGSVWHNYPDHVHFGEAHKLYMLLFNLKTSRLFELFCRNIQFSTFQLSYCLVKRAWELSTV